MSTKRKALSKWLRQLSEKRAKLDEAPQSSMTSVNYGYEEPGCSKNSQSIKMKDNQPMTNAQTDETASVSYDEQSTELYNQTLSFPLNVDNFPEDTIIDEEHYSQGVEQSFQSNSTTQSHILSNTTAATMTAPKLLSTTEQNSQPQITDVRSAAAVYVKHEKRINDIFDNEASTSHHLLNSRLMIANLYRQIEGARRLVPIQPVVTRQIRPMNIDRKLTIATQNSSILMNQNGSVSTCSVEEKSSVITPNHSQNDSQERPSFVQRFDRNLPRQEQYLQQTTRLQDVFQRPSEFQTNYQRTSPLGEDSFTESNNFNHRPNIKSIRMKSPQKQPQKPKICIDITITPKNNSQHSILNKVTKKTPSLNLSRVLNSIHKQLSATIHKNHLQKMKELQACRRVKSNKQNSTGLATNPENIAASATCEIDNEIPTCSSFQSPRTQHTENGHQNLRMQKQLVDQSTDSNLRMEEEEQEIESLQKVMGNTCQTDECMIDNSLYHGVTIDPDADTDHDEISDHDDITDEIPAETRNDSSTGIDTGYSPGDRPRSAQNSPSTSHQTDSRVVLEQQMLDNFGTLVTQMGSTLRYTCGMYNNLRRSILDTTETYKKLLNAVERFNTTRNVSTSSNVTPKVQQPAEERPVEVKVTKKKHNNLWRFVLPPNYDRNDSRWTLKYRDYLPGLVELVPESHIYVSYGDLKYCQKVSKDCKSLAVRLLRDVFNRDALSVCSSMTEEAQASNNVGCNARPGLDEHAQTILINFVIEHGLQRGWNTDLQPILIILHSKIQEMRFKYGIMEKC